MKRFSSITSFFFVVCFVSCNEVKKDLNPQYKNSEDGIRILECKLFGHKKRIEAYSGATILIEKPSNKTEIMVKKILNLPELNTLQSNITKNQSNDFVAISICDNKTNPFIANCLVDNYYKDSLIFKISIDTVKMQYRRVK